MCSYLSLFRLAYNLSRHITVLYNTVIFILLYIFSCQYNYMLMILILISIVVIFVSHIYVVLLGFCYCICYICYKYIIISTFSHKTSILKMSEILNPSYRAIFSYNSVLYIIHIIIRSLYLSVNSTFNTLYIIRVNHSLKAVARQFTKLCILLASKHINNHISLYVSS